MQVYDQVDAVTDDKNSVTLVADLIGKKKPYAYFLNYQLHGYGLFKVDQQSLQAYDQKLSLIEDDLTRKQLYNMLYEMMLSKDISGSYLLNLLKKHIVTERSESVLQENLQFNMPLIISNYIPLHLIEYEFSQLFELIVGQLLTPKIFSESVTLHMLVECAIQAARSDRHVELIRQWFETSQVTDLEGNIIEGIQVSTKHKQSIVKRIFASTAFDKATKDRILDDLQAIDSSDWTDKTKYFCRAAHPDVENKRELWTQYFNEEDLGWTYQNYNFSFSGFRQITQRDMIAEFTDDFFLKIKDVFKKKSRFIAESYFEGLKPNIFATPEDISKFESLLIDVQTETPDNSHLIKLLKNTITELKRKQDLRKLSLEYLDSLSHQ